MVIVNSETTTGKWLIRRISVENPGARGNGHFPRGKPQSKTSLIPVPKTVTISHTALSDKAISLLPNICPDRRNHIVPNVPTVHSATLPRERDRTTPKSPAIAFLTSAVQPSRCTISEAALNRARSGVFCSFRRRLQPSAVATATGSRDSFHEAASAALGQKSTKRNLAKTIISGRNFLLSSDRPDHRRRRYQGWTGGKSS